MKQKKKYVAPELTVVQFHAEHGYAASNEFTYYADYLNNQIQMQLADGSLADNDGSGNFAAGYMDNEDYTNNPTNGWQYGAGGWF